MPGSAAPVPTAFSVVCLKVDESFRSPPNRNQTFISMIKTFRDDAEKRRGGNWAR